MEWFGTIPDMEVVHFPLHPFNSLNCNNHFSRVKASVRTQPIHRREPDNNRNIAYKYHAQKKRQFFAEKDGIPSTLPLSRRNPRSIYRDIQKFARQNKLREALIIMDYMDQQGIPVNPSTFSSLISACARAKSLADAKQIHSHIRINGLEKNEFLRTKLVKMYTACGSLEDAKEILDDCAYASVYPWNALLRGAVISGGKKYGEVLSAYSQMRQSGINLDVYSFSNVIKSFAGASALRQGLKVHTLLIKNGLIDSSLLRTSLVDMYFKCGKIKLAFKVFEEMRERDIVSWGAMIAGFAHNRRHKEALDYFRWMVSEKIYPNSVILTTILPVIGEMRGGRRLGQEIHGYILKKKSYLRQLPIQSGLIGMYCKCGDMRSGRRVFNSSMERNAISWTALMSGYVSNGRLDQALRSFAWMQQEGFMPDVVTVATAIPICAELRALCHGKEIHAYALKNMFFPNVSITTSLIKMYSHCGILDYSVKLFNGMLDRNVISWTAMIDSYVEGGCIEEALNVFRSMLSSKHRPDSVVMARMLNVCSLIKVSKLGKEIHGHILKKNFLKIPFVSAELVKMYGACGLLYDANSVFNAIPVKGSMTWTAIIETYGYNNLWKDAINLFDEMISRGFTPSDYTFKAVLAICNQSGFADDALRISKLMSQRILNNAKEQGKGRKE